MGSTTSRDSPTYRKQKRKLPSLRSQKSNKDNSLGKRNTITRDYQDYNNTSPTSTISSKATTTETTSIIQPTTVKLSKYHIGLPDHVSPISPLPGATSHPTRKSSWRKSINTAATRNTNDNNSFSSYFDEDEDGTASSPRTSFGSEENNSTSSGANGVLKAENSNPKKHSPSFSISSFKSNGGGNRMSVQDIMFEPKRSSSLFPLIDGSNNLYNNNNSLKVSPKPFWAYNNGDEREYDRQLRQHYVLKHVLNGNIHIPIDVNKPIAILDAACGAGFWTLDVARTYPNAKVIGLDTFPADDKRMKGYSNTTIGAPNIVYKYGDLTSRLTLPDNYLDIIYQRDTASIVPHERWPSLLNELIRIAKPGGYIELLECSFNIKDPGPVLALVNEWYNTASTSLGVDPNQAKHLKPMLVDAGFENVEKKVITIPIGEWPTEKDKQEDGFLYKQVIKALFKSMKPWWISELAVSEEEYDRVVAAAMDEFDEQHCTIDWVVYTGRKPMVVSKGDNSSNDTTAESPIRNSFITKEDAVVVNY